MTTDPHMTPKTEKTGKKEGGLRQVDLFDDAPDPRQCRCKECERRRALGRGVEEDAW